jgi:alkylation response protein AidB-like acyl-CoA dehydrogenase
MDWNDTPEQARFRADVRSLIESRLPQRYRDMAAAGGPGERAWENDRKSSDPAARSAAMDWHAALNERRWVAPHWPKEYGGGGMSSMEQFILNQEMAHAGAPPVGGSGLAMLGPTIILHGSQERLWLRHLCHEPGEGILFE